MENLPNIEPFRTRFNDLEKLLSLPETFQDNLKATELSKEHRRLQGILDIYEDILQYEDELVQCKSLLEEPEMEEEAKDRKSVV